jgi:hypothetical protein
MPLSEAEIERLGKQRWSEPEEVYGPFRFGGLYLWELWIDTSEKANRSYWEVKFIVEESAQQLYFDTVAALIVHLNDLYQAATLQAGAMDWTRTKELAELERRKLTLYVASVVFGVTVLMMLMIVTVDQLVEIYRGPRISNTHVITLIVTTILGVVSSGAALFFGRWIPIGRGGQRVEGNGDAVKIRVAGRTRASREKRTKATRDDVT